MSYSHQTSLQEITFHVPSDYELPPLYTELNEDETAIALNLGIYAYELTKSHGEELTNKELAEKFKKAAHAKFEPELLTLKTQLQTLQQTLQDEKDRRLNIEKSVREEERRNREELLNEKTMRIQSLETQLKDLGTTIRESNRSLTDTFQNFKDQLLKNTTGSKKKGELGESVFETILERAFGSGSLQDSFDVQNVGSEGHQGDLRMHWQGHRFLLEVKHYERNVDGKEVTKFLRDMEESKDCPVGIMISLTTGITGHMKAGKLDIEMLHDGRMCIYLNSFLHHEDPVSLLQSMKPFLEVFLKAYSTNANQTSDSNQDESRAERQLELFQQQRKTVLKVLQSHEEQTRKMKNTLLNAKKKHEQSWIEIMSEMRDCEHRMKLLIETMFEFSIEEDTDADTDTDLSSLPGYVFRTTDIAMCTEKERKFLEDTCKHFDFHEDYKVSTKDAKEVYKKLGYSEDALTTMRTRLFQEDVWERGKKEIKYMRLKE